MNIFQQIRLGCTAAFHIVTFLLIVPIMIYFLIEVILGIICLAVFLFTGSIEVLPGSSKSYFWNFIGFFLYLVLLWLWAFIDTRKYYKKQNCHNP